MGACRRRCQGGEGLDTTRQRPNSALGNREAIAQPAARRVALAAPGRHTTVMRTHLAMTLVLLAFGGVGCPKPLPAPPAAASAAAKATFTSTPADGTLAHCVVMDRDFRVDETTTHHVHEGVHYAFCCESCLDSFEDDPARFAAKARAHDADEG